jgi:hypothetical protein
VQSDPVLSGVSRDLDKHNPIGWKSASAEAAERRGMLGATDMAKLLGVPVLFIRECAPKNEWHHVRKACHVGRRYYFDPIWTRAWFVGKRGQSAYKQWLKKQVVKP